MINTPIRSLKRVSALFTGGKRSSITGSPVDASESSLESLHLDDKADIGAHVGKLPFQDESLELNDVTTVSSSEPVINTVDYSRRKNQEQDDRMKNLIASYKSRGTNKPTLETPDRPSNNRSFKIDGVPACVSKQIELVAKKDAHRRRKRKQEKTTAAVTELYESFSNMDDSYSTAPPPTMRARKQRPKVHFLNLPKGHPLFWDTTKLSPAVFSEEERIRLAKILKKPNPIKDKRGVVFGVQATLHKLHEADWDRSVLGQAAEELFNRSNPLDLTPAVAKYFFKQFNNLACDLEEGTEITYKEDTFNHKEEEDDSNTNNNTVNNTKSNSKYINANLKDLYRQLRADFEEATFQYGATLTKPSNRCR